MLRKFLFLVFLLPGGSGLCQERILFVGNSLTYANRLPAILCSLATANGRTAECAAVAMPGVSLADQWADGKALERIREGRWTTVVLQQGPSGSADGRRDLRRYGKKFAREIEANGARTAFYMVWPSMERPGDFDRVIESYRLAAKDSGATLLPVGEAFRLALAKRVPILDSDQFHPSVAGSYLAALVIYRVVFGEMPKEHVIGFDAETREAMEAAVNDSCGD